MKFELDDDQVVRLKEWQKTIRNAHGLYGQYTFSFTPTGIGCHVEVYSELTEETLDLSDVEKW